MAAVILALSTLASPLFAIAPPMGVVPAVLPAGGFAIEGNLQANTPTNGVGDWIPNSPGAGGGVLGTNGVPLNALTTFHFTDPYLSGSDSIMTGGDPEGNPTNWIWSTGSVQSGKEDINNALLHVARDVSDHTWVIAAADHYGPGSARMDFIFMQNTLTKLTNGHFASAGPHGGLTTNDLRLTLDFSGTVFSAARWQTNTSGGGYHYVDVTASLPTNRVFMAVNGSAAPVPFGAFGVTSYSAGQFIEAAVDMTAFFGNIDPCFSAGFRTIMITTLHPDGDLSDFIEPFQAVVNVGLNADAGVDQTNCYQGGGGTFSLNGGVSTGQGAVTLSTNWSVVSGGAMIDFPNRLNPTVQVPSSTAGTNVTLRLTVTSTCSSRTDDVVLTVAPQPTLVINCASNKSVEFGNAWTFDDPPSAYPVTLVSTVTNAGCGNTYTATRTWSVTDTCGNSNTCSQTVSVVDTTAPAITCAFDRSVEFGANWSFGTPTATDIGGTNVITVLRTVTNATCGNTFTATRTWLATDACGNTNTCSQTVTLVDTAPPVINCSQLKTVEFGVAWAFNSPTATVIGGTNSITVLSTVTNATCGNTFTATRTWKATDACGNSDQCSQTVTVVDTTAPTITCSPAKTVEFGAAWSFDAPTATDIGGTNVITVLSTGTNAACGNTFTATRTWQAADACGNTNRCSQTVSVVDTTAPAITCSAAKAIEFGAAWNFDAPAATDSGGTNLITVLTTVTNAACGNTFMATRTWLATDACGNTNKCSQTVSVVDTTAPAITCAFDRSVEFGADWSFGTPTATDLGGTNVITVLATVTNATCGNTFIVTRTWLATDACGNTNTCSQTVTLVDTAPPVINCSQPKTVEFGALWNFDAPTATDIGGTNVITVLTTVTNATCGNTFTATRTWKATDACGNSDQCSQTVTVVDTTAPTIICSAPKTIEFGAAWSFDQPTATDIGGTNVITVLTTVTNAACGNTFTATRTWKGTDACGNTNVCSQTVSVVDRTAPTITCSAPKSIEFGAAWTFDQPTATDIGGTNVITVLTTVTNAACGNTFSATRTWKATDACGNTNVCSQTVSVVDRTAPTITCSPAKTIEFGVAWNFDQPTATDIGGTNVITILTTVTNATCGNTFTATRTWKATDACGNTNACSQTVSVVDTTAPTITCSAPKTVEFGAAWNFDQPTATDIGGTNIITVLTTVTNAACGNTFTATRTWKATDACGNTNTCSQTVRIVDTTTPTITCSAAKTIEFGAAWSFDPPTATDIGGTNVITVLTTVTNAACGNTFTATRTWKATDACGNTNTCSQTVRVVDTTAPTITCSPAKTIEFGVAWNFDQPTATDIGGTNVITVLTTVTNATCGNTFIATRTWLATDACGNTNKCSQTVIVVDTTAPAITCAFDRSVEFGADWSFGTPTATDLGGTNVITVLSTVTNAGCGNTFTATRTWLVTDACGNTNTCSQTVTLVDTAPPTITCTPARTVELGAAWNFDQPAATDLGGTNNITVLTTVTNAACGNTFVATRTWIATDACSNSDQCSQTVTIVDRTAPTITCSPAKTVEFGVGWSFDAPTATDIGGTNVVTVLSTVTNATCGNTFTAMRTWLTTDACGNTNTCSQTVAVADTTAPAITCNSAKTIEFGAAWSFDQPTATDIGGTNSITVLTTVTNATCGNTFTATRTWKATDACGNTNTCSQTVTVVDTTAPIITCSAAQTVEFGAAWSFAPPTATDIGGTNSITVLTTATNAACGNSFTATRTWKATDACGNIAQCSQTVSVVDTTPPTVNIILPASGAVFIAPATITLLAEAHDSGGPVARVEFFLGGSKVGEATNGSSFFVVLTNVAPGNYTVAVTATDSCGMTNAASPRNIIVLEGPPLSTTNSMRFNPQTGYIEQDVRVSNPTTATLNGVRIYICGLTNGATVHNATGKTSYTRCSPTGQIPFIQAVTAIPPGGHVDFVIEYAVPYAGLPSPTLWAELGAPLDNPLVSGTGSPIYRFFRLPDRSFLLEFATESNRLYYIQYSSDLAVWHTSPQAVIGTGNYIQWLDNGQPKTESSPSVNQCRFYRVIVLP